MINFSEYDFEKVHLLVYSDGKSKEDVELLNAVRINNGNWLRYDDLMVQYYGAGGESYLKLVLMFNNLNDITDINFGDMLYIPNLYSLSTVLEIIEDETPGITKFDDLVIDNSLSTADINKIRQPKDRRKTTASPNLLITKEQPSFKFDEQKGIISY